MRENRLRSIWKGGGAAVNGWLAIPSGFAAETMAHQGWDTLTIDLQHGVIDYAAMVTMLQAISTTPTVPVVRVPWNEAVIVKRVLDAGAATLAFIREHVPEARTVPLCGNSIGTDRRFLAAAPRSRLSSLQARGARRAPGVILRDWAPAKCLRHSS